MNRLQNSFRAVLTLLTLFSLPQSVWAGIAPAPAPTPEFSPIGLIGACAAGICAYVVVKGKRNTDR